MTQREVQPPPTLTPTPIPGVNSLPPPRGFRGVGKSRGRSSVSSQANYLIFLRLSSHRAHVGLFEGGSLQNPASCKAFSLG